MRATHVLRAICCGLAIAIVTSAGSVLAQAERGDAQRGDAQRDGAQRDGARSDGAADAWRWPGALVWELALRVGVPPDTGFDRALAAHGYGELSFAPGVATALAFPVGVEWLWLGGQLGVRGRTWSHGERDAASAVGVDLLVVARARFHIDHKVELGLTLGGGLGWLGVWVNGVGSDQIVPRFDVQADLAFAIGRHFALGPRIGWSYFVREGINAYGHSVDIGGPHFGLSLEGRE